MGRTMLQVANILPTSSVNGPGERVVVHFQGCTLGCLGCFNPHTHDPAGGSARDVFELAKEIRELARGKAGVTFSGGEPFQQNPTMLGALLMFLRQQGHNTDPPPVESVVLFTGYSMKELRERAVWWEVLRRVDVVIAGRYQHSVRRAHQNSLLSSVNQRLYILSEVYTPGDFYRLENDAEVERLRRKG